MSYTGSIPDTAVRRHDWMARMACRNEDPDLFSDPEHEHEARIICAVRCPVRDQCLTQVKQIEAGLAKERRDGVVAGLTAHERWRLDASAAGHSDKPALVFHERPPCGTYNALLRHLHFGEQIDPECWSAEVRRDRLAKADSHARRRRPKPVELESAAPEPLVPAAPATSPVVKGDTPHERRVHRLWSEGLTDIQIARRMAISTPQVQRVRTRLGLLPVVQSRAS